MSPLSKDKKSLEFFLEFCRKDLLLPSVLTNTLNYFLKTKYC